MIGQQPTGILKHAVISAVAHEDLEVTSIDGKKLMLAIIDQDGNIIESGQAVAREARSVSLNCYRNFMQGKGWLRVFSGQEAQNQDQINKAA